ncbi:hypothetical protein B0H34DRAFT_736537 [Crassisporium funariophilum]|nr:hypothetical protein B0H34DRAFT_736537 [Crassisporium funariophilum]
MSMQTGFLLPLPVEHTTYARDSSRTFKLPPLDGSLTLPEIYDWHLDHNSSHTLFIFESNTVGYTHLTYADVVPAAYRAARYVGSAINVNVDNHHDVLKPVAILATSDTITTFCVLLGMMRSSIPIFVISPQNAPSTVSYLLDKSTATHVLISGEKHIRQLFDDSCELVYKSATSSTKAPFVPILMPKYDDIFKRGGYIKLKPRKFDLEQPVIFSHSSGSTALPKAIPWTHPFLLQAGVAPLYGSHNFCNELFAWHGVSMSHGTGIHMMTWMPTAGMIAAVLPPKSPACVPTAEVVFEGFLNLKADYLISFPHFIETWSKDSQKVQGLKAAKGVVFAGGFLNISIGNELVERGVKIFPLFGLAEAGVVGSFLPPHQGKDWEFFSLTPHSGGRFIDAGDGFYELMIVNGPTKHLQITNTKYGTSDAYSSGDLFVEHPKNPGFWKCVGRTEHRIVNTSGEKFDPAPLEHNLGNHPQIKAAVVFGNQKPRNGLLLELSDEIYFDPSDSLQLSAFREKIWPIVQEANHVTPAYARISKEVIFTCDLDKGSTEDP